MSLRKLYAARRQVGRIARRLAVWPAAALLAACVGPATPASSPLIGSWVTPDHDQVTFREDTVVLTPDNGQPTPMSREDCAGNFRLAYGRMTSESLETLFPHQPDLRVKLKALLVAPVYPAANLDCDRGGTTYVLLDDRDLIAIYRDADIAGIQRLTRL